MSILYRVAFILFYFDPLVLIILYLLVQIKTTQRGGSPTPKVVP